MYDTTTASYRGPRAAFACAALPILMLFFTAAVEARPAARRILLLQSLSRGNIVLDTFTGDFRVDLDRLVGSPINVVQIVTAPTGLEDAPEQDLVVYIHSIFPSGREPDLIVTTGGPAALFARRFRSQLFPDVPLLFASVDQRFLRDAPLSPNETAVAVINDFSVVIEDILHLLPDTRQVMMVVGSGELGQYWHRHLETEYARFRDRVTFVWTDGLSFQEILRRSASLPDNSAIFYLTFGTDAVGAAYADERVLRELYANANAPLLGAYTPLLGYGIVGGRLLAIDDLARRTAEVAVRLLDGVPAASIRPPAQGPGRPQFDWRQLKRWDIPESRLPAGSDVSFRARSPWEQYRLAILSALAALLIQSILIVSLVRAHRARQRAEIDSRKNLALAADASRRQVMSALTNSMAHELGQPLSSMMYDTHALQMMVGGGHPEPATMGEILSDINAQGLRAQQIIDRHRMMLRSRHLEKAPIDVHMVIRESLALVAHELKEREIDVSLELSADPSVVHADPVLVQQVLVNLVMNAIDAMAATPPNQRKLTVRSENRPAELEVSIRDNGTGVPDDVLDTLFTPFITTKSHGLGIGLTIARNIVEAHGGTIRASNNPEGGAALIFTLRKTDYTPALQRAEAANV